MVQQSSAGFIDRDLEAVREDPENRPESLEDPESLDDEFDPGRTLVDNELQLLIPLLLRAILGLAWDDRLDWFFGVNLGLYSQPGEAPLGPDGFLSLGVPRYRQAGKQPDGKLRISYVVWKEDNVMPLWVLEIVSKKPGSEYGSKFREYARLGVLYYTIYNPDHWQRDQHDRFEVYKLIDGAYVRQDGNPVWMPEIELGIGHEPGTHGRLERDWLYWYNQQGDRLPAPEDIIQQERQRREQAERQAIAAEQQLAELYDRLRARGIDPDAL